MTLCEYGSVSVASAMAEGLDSDERDRQKKTESILLWRRNVEIATQQGPHVSYELYLHIRIWALPFNYRHTPPIEE